jgi:hypothetical protein
MHPVWNLEPAQNRFLIRIVGDAETDRQADLLAELSQQLGAESVDGAALDALHAGAKLALETLGDFSSGFIGERKDADARRIDLQLLDQEPDALDEAERLARTWTGEHEQRLRAGLDGGAL